MNRTIDVLSSMKKILEGQVERIKSSRGSELMKDFEDGEIAGLDAAIDLISMNIPAEKLQEENMMREMKEYYDEEEKKLLEIAI